jgi:hypothetical protein
MRPLPVPVTEDEIRAFFGESASGVGFLSYSHAKQLIFGTRS